MSSCYLRDILIYHIFCNKHFIQERKHAPTSREIITAFLTAITRLYSALTVKNYYYGMCPWHLIDCKPWLVNETKKKVVLAGTAKLAAKLALCCSECQLIILKELKTLCIDLQLNNPLNIAMHVCTIIIFWSLAHLSKLTAYRLDKTFNPAIYV